METRKKILDSLTPILVSPKFVFIDSEKVKSVARKYLEVPVPAWDNELQFLGSPEETAQYYFFLDSINFCFWAPKGENRWEYKIGDQWVGGYYAYSRAIKDAFLKDSRYFAADYLSSIPEKDFENIFQGRNKLLLMPERLSIIRENFSILEQKFAGKVINILEEARKDADKVINLLIENFPSFRDTVNWQNDKLLFLKRAQIFSSDLFFTGLDSLRLSNLEHLTVFADYKLPQILESLGVINYSEELNSDITRENLIPAGSLKEIELRASSVIAAEQMRNELVRLGRNITSNEFDWILWVQAKQTKFAKPHHKTITTFY